MLELIGPEHIHNNSTPLGVQRSAKCLYVYLDVGRIGGLLSLVHHLREDANLLVWFDDDNEGTKPVHPLIVCKGSNSLSPLSFSVEAEGIVISKTDSFVNFVLLLLATYYVFNLVYPDKLVATLIFIQKYFLNIQDSVKRNSKVVTLLGKLHKLC